MNGQIIVWLILNNHNKGGDMPSFKKNFKDCTLEAYNKNGRNI